MRLTGKAIYVLIPLEKQGMIISWKTKLLHQNEDITTRLIKLIESDLNSTGENNGYQ